MEFRVGELAAAASVGVDTIRFYQARGLIPPPERRGRFAIYSGDHLERLRRIRRLLESGFSLAQIRRLLVEPGPGRPTDDPEASSKGGLPRTATGDRRRRDRDSARDRALLEALATERVGDGTVSRAELASETGVPEALVTSVVRAGLIAPIEVAGEERFPRSDLEMVRAALEILGMGLPLDRLLELASDHAEHVDDLVERAIDLFDEHVRTPRGEDDEGVRQDFERLLPFATKIVALHFQRTLVARALARLRARGEAGALEKALEATRRARLEVQWR